MPCAINAAVTEIAMSASLPISGLSIGHVFIFSTFLSKVSSSNNLITFLSNFSPVNSIRLISLDISFSAEVF